MNASSTLRRLAYFLILVSEPVACKSARRVSISLEIGWSRGDIAAVGIPHHALVHDEIGLVRADGQIAVVDERDGQRAAIEGGAVVIGGEKDLVDAVVGLVGRSRGVARRPGEAGARKIGVPRGHRRDGEIVPRGRAIGEGKGSRVGRRIELERHRDGARWPGGAELRVGVGGDRGGEGERGGRDRVQERTKRAHRQGRWETASVRVTASAI